MGDEPYYIDKIADFAYNKILDEQQKEFNQNILYGKDVTVEDIISEAKQFPFGSENRVLIIKEAQHIKNIDKLQNYIANPQLSTLLFICYKGKTIDRRKKIVKELEKNCIVFESKQLYENQIPKWISSYLRDKGFHIDEKSTVLLSNFLGLDLSNIVNELEKLMLVVDSKKIITNEIIEKNIGISKDYNIFELQNALSERNSVKCYEIIKYFISNTKRNPLVIIIGSLFSFFQKIMTYHNLKDKSRKNASNVLKINPFFLNQYIRTSKHYNTRQLLKIFTIIKEYDLRSKGIKNRNTNEKELLRELIFKILNT